MQYFFYYHWPSIDDERLLNWCDKQENQVLLTLYEIQMLSLLKNWITVSIAN